LAILKYLARDHRFFISDDEKATWTSISGISSWEFSIDTNEEDVSDFDAGGWGSNIATMRTASLSLEGFYLVDALTGARDTGQYKWEVAAMQVGYSATRSFRIEAYTVSGGLIGSIEVTGTPSVESFGGSTTDVLPWGGSVAVLGQPAGSGVYGIFN
jgi:hypothetical protein